MPSEYRGWSPNSLNPESLLNQRKADIMRTENHTSTQLTSNPVAK